ncbi:MAG TPA: hypothetical protein VFT67_11795 [Jatrophihabitantaceae bacterium]|nr:hypothetical protein [Jatrophihabitantaceae bacterium]
MTGRDSAGDHEGDDPDERGDRREADEREPSQQQPRRPKSGSGPAGRDDRPVLPRVAEAERDEAWGDRSRSAERDADWYREQRPPHHE